MTRYIVNKWGVSSKQHNCACVFGTNDRAAFERKIQELKDKEGLTNADAHLVVRRGLVIFSYYTGNNRFEWVLRDMAQSPLAVRKPFK